MTEDEARRLATRCVDTWPAGSKGYIWRDELVKHPYTIAAQAIDQLTASHRGRPAMPGDLVAVIATIQAEKRAESGASVARNRTDCEHCGGTGFEPGPPIYEIANGEPHEYATVTECRCTRPAARAPAPEQLEAF